MHRISRLCAGRCRTCTLSCRPEKHDLDPQGRGFAPFDGAFEFRDWAFPSNDFGQQEPDGNDAVQQFATAKYKTDFPLFAKIDVTGDHLAPLYQLLTDKPAEPTTRGPVRWSFTNS